jgi:hypothetical protein
VTTLDRVYDANDVARALGVTPRAVRKNEDFRAEWFRIPGKRGAVITKQQYEQLIEKWQEQSRG